LLAHRELAFQIRDLLRLLRDQLAKTLILLSKPIDFRRLASIRHVPYGTPNASTCTAP
jgi:hypothetical protein